MASAPRNTSAHGSPQPSANGLSKERSVDQMARFVGSALGICLASAIISGVGVLPAGNGLATALVTVLIVAAVLEFLGAGLLRLATTVSPRPLGVLNTSLSAFGLDVLLLAAMAALSDPLGLSLRLDGFWSLVLATVILVVSQLVTTIVLAITRIRDAGDGTEESGYPATPAPQ